MAEVRMRVRPTSVRPMAQRLVYVTWASEAVSPGGSSSMNGSPS